MSEPKRPKEQEQSVQEEQSLYNGKLSTKKKFKSHFYCLSFETYFGAFGIDGRALSPSVEE